jgi:hypothetical protein
MLLLGYNIQSKLIKTFQILELIVNAPLLRILHVEVPVELYRTVL